MVFVVVWGFVVVVVVVKVVVFLCVCEVFFLLFSLPGKYICHKMLISISQPFHNQEQNKNVSLF